MSVYDTAATAMRDTVKWLVALVPVASLTAATAVVGKNLLDNARGNIALSDWLDQNWTPLIGIGMVAVGVGLIVSKGTSVLVTEPTDFTELMTNPARLAVAFGAGVGSPYFDTEAEFRDALATLAVVWGKDPPDNVDDSTQARAVATTDTLREWAWFDLVRSSFRSFQKFLVAGTVLCVGGILFATATISSVSAEISKPILVEVRVDAAGGQDLLAATGCTDPENSIYTAVAGTWSNPKLAVDGPGCRFGAHWTPHPEHIELRNPSPEK